MILGHHQVATDMKLPDGREWKLLLLNCLCRLIGDSVTHESMAATAGNWWGVYLWFGFGKVVRHCPPPTPSHRRLLLRRRLSS